MTDDRSPRLVWTDDGSPRSGRFDDIYFSREDGLAESRAVFLAGCGLPDAWAGRRRFTVAELGFGTGLNIAALLDLWRRECPADGHLSIFSVEGFPLDRAEASRALSAWPEIADASDALLSAWPAATPGFHRLDLPAFRATLDLAVGDAAWALDQWTGRADAWFLDGFSPATNPGMWSQSVFDRIAARSAPDARIATFTVAGAVRRALTERDFLVDKRPGHGRKRQRLEARGQGAALRRADLPAVVIVGAGIAGAAAARACAAAGLGPVLIEAERAGAGASGFPAALVTPRFDLGDAAVAGLFAQALERATDLYRRIPGAVLEEGVVQLPQTERDLARFARIADQPIWSDGAVTLIDAEGASDRTGARVSGPALDMAGAMTVAPAAILSSWLEGVDCRTGKVAAVERQGERWRLLDPAGAVLAEADAVILCAGAGLTALSPQTPISPVRGQANWVEGSRPVATAWGGYVAPTDKGFLFGATHDRGEIGTDVLIGDTERNLATLTARLPALAAALNAAACAGRAAVRATTRDRLPMAGAVIERPGMFVLGGLGSRGFCLAPLLAEHLVALVLDHPSPLPGDVARRITPSRAACGPV